MESLKPSASGRPLSAPMAQIVLVLFVLVAAPGCDVIGAVQFYLGNEFSRAEWGATGDTIVLPINVTTHVSLPIGVNGSSPLRFVLDTGAPGIGIIGNSRTDAIGLKLGPPAERER